MGDSAIRAITIGVGVIIAIATISAVMTYYNTAKQAVTEIGTGTDIAALYEEGITKTLLKTNITGTDVKNLLDYFGERNDVNKIDVKKIKLQKNNSSSIRSTKFRNFI